MEKPKKSDYSFSFGMCNNILKEKEYNEAMSKWRVFQTNLKMKKFNISYDGKFVECISSLYKKNIWDLIRSTKKDNQLLRLFKVEQELT